MGRASSCLSRGDESFFSAGGLGSFAKGISSPKGVLPSDLDLRCMGRGGAGGFISAPARLGAGGTGGVRRFAASGGRLLTSGGDCLVEVAPGSSNLGLAGNGGRGTSIPNRFSRLTEEQRTGGIGGGDSDPVLAPSDLEGEEHTSIRFMTVLPLTFQKQSLHQLHSQQREILQQLSFPLITKQITKITKQLLRLLMTWHLKLLMLK